MLYLLNNDRQEFNRQLNAEAVISFALSGFSNGIPVICYWAFRATWDGRRSVNLIANSPAPLTGAQGLLRMGVYEPITAFLAQNPRFVSTTFQPSDIKRLIQIDIDADRDRVLGHPIDVLVVHRDGARWYDRETNSVCPE